MARYKVPHLNSNVQLRKWSPGRVAQLKLFLGHLEQAIGVSLAAQVEQSPKRKFSEFVPRIVPQDVTTELEFREIRVSFEPPKGIKNLLFYEYQISGTENFFNFDQFVSPEPNYVFPALNDGTTYYIRMRVVTKDGEVGPWSDTEGLTTPLAQTYGLYDSTEITSAIKYSEFYTWFDVYERQYTAIGGTAYYAIDYDIEAIRQWFSSNGTFRGNIEWSDVSLRWLMRHEDDANYSQLGQDFDVTAYSSNLSFGNTGFYRFQVSVVSHDYTTPLEIPGTWANPRRGTFVQKLTQLDSGDYDLKLQARVFKDHTNKGIFQNDFYPFVGGSITYGAKAYIKLKNFHIFEALTDDD